MFSINHLKHLVYEIIAPAKHLRETYKAFRKLLEYDHQSHEMLALLEKLYHEKKGVDFYAAVKGYNGLSHGVSKMVELLETMALDLSENFFRLLQRRFIHPNVRSEIEEPDPSSPFVLLLDQIATGAEKILQAVKPRALEGFESYVPAQRIRRHNQSLSPLLRGQPA
jgi:hypothetical protein